MRTVVEAICGFLYAAFWTAVAIVAVGPEEEVCDA